MTVLWACLVELPSLSTMRLEESLSHFLLGHPVLFNYDDEWYLSGSVCVCVCVREDQTQHNFHDYLYELKHLCSLAYVCIWHCCACVSVCVRCTLQLCVAEPCTVAAAVDDSMLAL